MYFYMFAGADDSLTAAVAVVGLTLLLHDRQAKEQIPGSRAASPLR